jgi:phosphoribosyl-AMP cyclohydrolase
MYDRAGEGIFTVKKYCDEDVTNPRKQATVPLPTGTTMNILDTVKYDANGLVPAIAQDDTTGDILMMAWMNRESLEETVRTKRAVYWSRSRGSLWRKGEQSGNVQEVNSIRLDCDADVILLRVNQIGGAACHTGHRTCFFREVSSDGNDLVEQGEILFDPNTVYKK